MLHLIYKDDRWEIYYISDQDSNPYSVYLKHKDGRCILKYRCKTEEDAKKFIQK